jgi:hypothetical protein
MAQLWACASDEQALPPLFTVEKSIQILYAMICNSMNERYLFMIDPLTLESDWRHLVKRVNTGHYLSR